MYFLMIEWLTGSSGQPHKVLSHWELNNLPDFQTEVYETTSRSHREHLFLKKKKKNFLNNQ